MKQPRAFHPPLFALHPLLALYAANVSLIPWRDAVLPAAVSAAGTWLLWMAAARALKDSARAAAAVSIGVWLTFTFDVWGSFFEGGAPPIVVWGLGTGALMLAVGWKRKSVGTLTTFMNVVGAALCALALFTAGSALWGIRSETARIVRASGPSTGYQGVRPDIFHLVLDGYGRTDVFERDYGFSDAEFVEGLRRRGFFVAADARSNYVQTELSLASMLNLEMIQGLVRTAGDTVRDRAVLDAMIDRSKVSRTLKARGYRTFALTTGFPALEFASADVVLGADVGRSMFVGALLEKTPFRPGSGGAESQFSSRRKYVTGAFENIKRLATPGPSPRFVLAHVLAPHPPFVFGPNGEPLRPRGAYTLQDGSHYLESGKSRDEYIEGYRGQAQMIARLTLEAVDALLERGGPRPIIVIHGDHGPKAHLDQDSLEGTDVNESFPILEAVLAPPAVQARLKDRTTPVNVYRALFSGIFGDALPPLADRSYYSAWMSPLEFTEVSDQITLRKVGEGDTMGRR